MRTSATTLTTAIFAVSLPLAAMADTTVINGVMYSDNAETVFVDNSYAAPASDNYSEILYVPDIEAYQATEETLAVVEYSQGETFSTDANETTEETSAFAEYLQSDALVVHAESQSVITEIIDGIVYETVMEGDLVSSDETPIIYTY